MININKIMNEDEGLPVNVGDVVIFNYFSMSGFTNYVGNIKAKVSGSDGATYYVIDNWSTTMDHPPILVKEKYIKDVI